jgi:DNA-3-methyladenine glycosylase II
MDAAAPAPAPLGPGLTLRQAATAMAARDPVIAKLVALDGLPKIERFREGHFPALIRSITYQQIAGAAARAIHGRLVAAAGGEVTPERILALSDQELRAAGLSGNKAASVRDLSAKVLDGTVILEPRRLARLSSDEVTARLSSVRGIGPWSAQVFELFQLKRPDIWLTGDLGVRQGYGLAFGIPMPTPKQLEPLGDPYRPYRSVLTWYCWVAARHYGGSTAADVAG